MKQQTKRKKKIDQNDLDGKPVAPIGTKEKKLDLTDEIKIFLGNEITLDTIKHIIKRLEGPIEQRFTEKLKMKIFGVPNHNIYGKIDYNYLIIIDGKWISKYYIGGFNLFSLTFGRVKEKEESDLKQKLRIAIEKWLDANHDKITLLTF